MNRPWSAGAVSAFPAAPSHHGVAHALAPAACFKPKKLQVHLNDLAQLATRLGERRFEGPPVQGPDYAAAALSSILGCRSAVHVARPRDNESAALVGHLLDKKRITQADLLKLHARLAPEASPGIRRSHVKVDGWDAATAVYIPPAPETLGRHVKDLIEWMNKPCDRSLVTSLAVATQWLLVHPFSDGNGRVARASFILAARGIGPRMEIVDAVDALWKENGLLVQAVMHAVMDDGWNFKFVETLIGKALAP